MAALRLHGLRNRLFLGDLRRGLMSHMHEFYLEDEPKAEEGWSTENQVRFRVKSLLNKKHRGRACFIVLLTQP